MKIPLPIDDRLDDIISAIKQSRAVVIVAEPGAGKTTRVPPAILRAGLLSADHPNLVMLQPRRVAARAAAARIADENGWQVGDDVGYHIRFDRKIGRNTRLRVLTEGILTRQLLDDAILEGVGCVVLDEFHERSLHSDMALAMLKEVKATVRDDLILIVMSATLDAGPVAQFLGNCPIVRVEGRTFPVRIEHHSAPLPNTLPHRIAALVGTQNRDGSDFHHRFLPRKVMEIEHKTGTGAVFNLPETRASESREREQRDDLLVFLPGVEEIHRTAEALAPLARREDLLVVPLHGSLPAEEQFAALAPSQKRKIILATNIAETSLTIDGVTAVIDSGLARIAAYDAQRGLDRLDLKRISKASATQRAGRAGRTAPGRCIRLWSEKEHAALEDFELPEVCRVDLCGAVLALHDWGSPDPRHFGWFDPPPEATLVVAEQLLVMLGALSGETGGRITPLGRRLMSLPVHPRLARMLLAAADAGRLEEGAAMAALMSEKDIVAPRSFEERGLRQATTTGPSDLLVRIELLEYAERNRFAWSLRDEGIDPVMARQAARTRDELMRIAGRSANRGLKTEDRELRRHSQAPPSILNSLSTVPDPHLLQLPLLAYPDRVCRRRGSDPLSAVMVGGGGVRLARESVVAKHEYFVAIDARQDPRNTAREALVRIASGIDVQWLDELFPEQIRRERLAEFDEARGRVVGRGRMYYRDLLLREDADAAVDIETAGRVLAEWASPRAFDLLRHDERIKRWLARIDLLHKAMPDKGWPVLDEGWARQVIADACRGKRSLDELKTAFPALVQGMLEYPQDRLLETEAPDAIQVPTGNAIRLDYPDQTDFKGDIQPPVLAVRLQELFGLTDTPRIAGGRVKVVLHLLGPNYRPVQVTSDLASFWKNTYPQVRKDLRARYPKHSWPDDPTTAVPEAKGRRHR